MKRVFATLLLSLAAMSFGNLYAQNSTTIRAYFTVEKQVVRTGPYARFAPKYLGVVAPLTDKQVYTITNAKLYAGDGAMAAISQPAYSKESAAIQSVSHTRNSMEFTKVPVDRMDAVVRSVEDAAREAANKIFALRKARIELITGAAGENVFGDGMKAALEELDRLEEEFVALFMGKQSTQTTVEFYDVTPQAGDTNRIVCRFSESAGLLPESDLSGSPIVLELKVVDMPAAPAVAAKPGKNEQMVTRRVAAQVNCRLTDGKSDLASLRTPIVQMGREILVPAGSN